MERSTSPEKITKIEVQCGPYAVEADWYEGASKDKVLLFMIGYDSNRKKQRNLTTALVEQAGTNALVFDFSGMGESPFELDATRPAHHFLEAVCAFDWIKENHPDSEVTVLGSSYGGYLAVKLTEQRQFPRLILRVPAIYPPEAFYKLQPEVHIPSNRELRKEQSILKQHPLMRIASKFDGKTLVVVHGKDEAIPKATTDAYINAFNADVYEEPEFTHSLSNPENPADKMEGYQKAIANWLK